MNYLAFFMALATAVTSVACTAPDAPSDSKEQSDVKRIALIAGPKSHGPTGNGYHDYPWNVRLLKVMLDHSNIAQQIEVTYYLDGWPADQSGLESADTIVVISDGRDAHIGREALHLETPERIAFVQEQMDRGCGLLTFHFSVFAAEEHRDESLQWTGGYFQWEQDGERKWYSAITTVAADVALATPDHAINRGVKPFRMRDEYYYNIRFDAEDERTKPIIEVPELNGREGDGNVVAWARQREDGGRGFGTTCGHFYDSWENEHFRKMMLNAVAWTAGVPIPENGVEAQYYTHEQIELILDR